MFAAEQGARPSDEDLNPFVLRKRVTHYQNESLPGLVMRTAELYRFREAARLFRRIGGPGNTILWTLCRENADEKLGGSMASLLGLDTDEFRRMSMWTGDETTLSVLGTPVWRDLVRHSVRAVCPECLREANYHRAVWLIDAMPVCAVHGTWLIERCPKPGCGRLLDWDGLGVHRCRFRGCAFDMRGAKSRQADPETLGGVRALHRLLHEADDAGMPLGMPRGEALRMAFVLRQIALGHVTGTRPNGYIKRHLEQLPQVLDAGWQALDDWPHGFQRFLERLLARAADKKTGGGLKEAFGKLSKHIYQWAREPWGAPVGVAFTEFVTAQPSLAVSGHMLRRYSPGTELRHVHISLADASKLLEVGPATMLAVAERRNMFARRPHGSGVPALLRADAVRELAVALDDFLSPGPARARLGVGYRLLKQLEGAGLIRRVPKADRVMEVRPFRKSEIDDFLKACRGRAKPISKLEAKEASLSRITRVSAPGRGVPDICRALMSGRLQAVAVVTGEHGLWALRFRMDEVGRAAPAVVQTMSMVEAAKGLDVAYRFLHDWARNGLLETTKSDRPGERGLRVTAEGLARFQETYATSRDLKVLFGQDRNHWLSRHLAFQGILPVSGRGVDDGDKAVFRRAELTSQVIRAVQAGPQGTGPEKHRAAFAKAARAAGAVAGHWGADFHRTNNYFEDPATGRSLQVVSGRRPDLTGVFRFTLLQSSLERLRNSAEGWVAMVPAQGDVFLLVPWDAIPWRADGELKAYAILRFDVAGLPLDAPEGAVAIRLR